MTDYQPIACERYAALELAIIRGRALQAVWRDAHGGHCIGRLVPLDLYTRASEEFLVARSASGEQLTIRLDRLRQFHAVAGE